MMAKRLIGGVIALLAPVALLGAVGAGAAPTQISHSLFPNPLFSAGSEYITTFAVGEIDGYGTPDALVGSSDYTVEFVPGGRAGAFLPPVALPGAPLGIYPTWAGITDFNSDGTSDVVAVGWREQGPFPPDSALYVWIG